MRWVWIIHGKVKFSIIFFVKNNLEFRTLALAFCSVELVRSTRIVTQTSWSLIRVSFWVFPRNRREINKNFQTLQSVNLRIVSSVSWSAMTLTSSWSTRTTLSSFVTSLIRILPQFRPFLKSHQRIIHTMPPRTRFWDALRECSQLMTWSGSTAAKLIVCSQFVIELWLYHHFIQTLNLHSEQAKTLVKIHWMNGNYSFSRFPRNVIVCNMCVCIKHVK